MKKKQFFTAMSILPAIWLGGPQNVHAQTSELQNISKQQIDFIEPCFELRDENSHPSFDLIEPDPCDGGGGGPTEPTRAPSKPTLLDYPVFSKKNTFEVSWGASQGYGFSVKYRLYQSVNGGSWQKIYDGYGTRHMVAHSGNSPKRAKFKVQAYNTRYSSAFKQSNDMLIKPTLARNLYDTYPQLRDVDEKNASYYATNPNLKTNMPRDKIVGQHDNSNNLENRFYLGDGYDRLRGVLKETCLDVNHPGFNIVQTPANTYIRDVEYVDHNEELATLLDVSSSGKIGINIDDFSFSLSGEKKRYIKSVTDNSHVRFVVKFKTVKQNWRLNTPVDAIYPELTNYILSPGDDQAKADFRERCGDNYVNDVNIGAALYLVYSFDAKKYTYEEKESHKVELKSALEDVFELGGSTTSIQELSQVVNSLNVTVKASQIGGPLGAENGINKDNAVDRFEQFIANTNSSNWAAVDVATSNYQRPTVYNSYSHDEIFAKYYGNHGPESQIRRWLSISVQHKERCDPFTEYEQAYPAECRTGAAEIANAMDQCFNTLDWDNCTHPSSYTTGNPYIVSSGTHLLSWLSTNIKKLRSDSKYQSYSHHSHRQKKLVKDTTCLSTSSCFANVHKGGNRGFGRGFTYSEGYVDEVRNIGFYPTQGTSCLISQANLHPGTCWFCDTTADWNYSINLEGMCPEDAEFIIVP